MVSALHPLVPELAFQLPRHNLVLAEIVAIGNGPHGFRVDAAPDNVKVLTPFLHMLDDDARLIGQAKLLRQAVNRADFLRVGHLLVVPPVDVGVIKRLPAAGAFTDGGHFAKGGG